MVWTSDFDPASSLGDYFDWILNASLMIGRTNYSSIPLSSLLPFPFRNIIEVAYGDPHAAGQPPPGSPPGFPGLPEFSAFGLTVNIGLAGSGGIPDFFIGLQSAEYTCTAAAAAQLPGFCNVTRLGKYPTSDALPATGAEFLNMMFDPANAANRILAVNFVRDGQPQLGDYVSAAATVDRASVPEPMSALLLSIGLGALLGRRMNWTTATKTAR